MMLKMFYDDDDDDADNFNDWYFRVIDPQRIDMPRLMRGEVSPQCEEHSLLMLLVSI